MFSMSLVLYFMGFSSPLLYLWNNQGAHALEPVCDPATQLNCQNTGVLNRLTMAILPSGDLLIAGLIALAITGLVASLLGGFSAMFIIPLLIVSAVAVYLVLPFSFIFSMAMPDEIRIPLFVFMNIITVIAFIDFVRGSS
jgi:hypothetical protein